MAVTMCPLDPLCYLAFPTYHMHLKDFWPFLLKFRRKDLTRSDFYLTRSPLVLNVENPQASGHGSRCSAGTPSLRRAGLRRHSLSQM